jgi:hypothetical protein
MIRASLLSLIAFATAFSITDPQYQAYYIYYDAPGCNIADISNINIATTWDSPTPSGTDINSKCTFGKACAASGSGSYEIVCVNGEPINLGVKTVTLRGNCDSSTIMPFEDNYVATGSIPSREGLSYHTWRDGCHNDGSWSDHYNFVSVNAGGNGCSVHPDGACGTAGSCTMNSCTSTPLYLNTTSSGCTASSSFDYLECATTVFNSANYPTKADLFFYDPNRIVFTLGNCVPGCFTYLLGNGVCNSACWNANCDNDCNSTVCDCQCTKAAQSSCCTPSAYMTATAVNQCCESTPADIAQSESNVNYIKVFEACICDQVNNQFTLTKPATLSSLGVCDVPSSVATTFNPTIACTYAKTVEYCWSYALIRSAYTSALDNTTSATQWLASAVSAATKPDGTAPMPSCIAVGGRFSDPSITGTSLYPTGSAMWTAESQLATYGSTCVVCFENCPTPTPKTTPKQATTTPTTQTTSLQQTTSQGAGTTSSQTPTSSSLASTSTTKTSSTLDDSLALSFGMAWLFL